MTNYKEKFSIHLKKEPKIKLSWKPQYPKFETQQRYLYTSTAEANFRKDTWQHTSSPRLIKKKGGETTIYRGT